MAGNIIGVMFRVSSFGESHGPCVGAVVDGCPAQLHLSPSDFQKDMTRRQGGRRPSDTPRQESDEVEILSGVFEGQTTGAPITLLIRNQDARSQSYEVLRTLFRPGHADYAYYQRFGHFDFRGGGRASARETAARVAAGVVAGKILEPRGIKVQAYTVELGGIGISGRDLSQVEEDHLYCPDREASQEMEQALARAREEGDTLGGLVEVRVTGCPAGLGEPVFDKLDAELAKAVMSIGSVKGVEIGAGFEAARLKGSENNDPILPSGFKTNHAGGILGGISNGDEIIIRAATKPIPTIGGQQETIDRQGRAAKIKMKGRFDCSTIPRIIPVLEAMVKIVLADHYLRFKAIQPG